MSCENCVYEKDRVCRHPDHEGKIDKETYKRGCPDWGRRFFLGELWIINLRENKKK